MKPANIVLDLLRTYQSRGTSARHIMATGEMFGLTQNLTRVTLSRLVSKGLIEKVARGQYRLAQTSDPVSDFVEEWRLGEARLRPWLDESYLLVHGASHTDKDRWVLTATGFRCLQGGLWARPDNLTRTGTSLEQWLMALGLGKSNLIIQGGLPSQPFGSLLKEGYDIPGLRAGYLDMTAKLKMSAASLASLPRKDAMATSFQLGGKAIQLLAKDPYLPEALMPISEREQLWQTMIDYDTLGRGIWTESPATMPVALASYT